MKKGLLAIAVIVVGVMFACSLEAKTLEEVLKDATPVDHGTCNVPTEKHGVMAMACTKGVRTDGATIYLILDGGQPIAVYEQIGDGVPKLIWASNWQGA